MISLLGGATSDIIDMIYKETKKTHNQKRINKMIDIFTNLAIRRIQPYMYAIMAILIILFLMNCFQFFFYIKLVNNNDYQLTTIA